MQSATHGAHKFGFACRFGVLDLISKFPHLSALNCLPH
jgi:hypothetical protein